jgi:hypothetical protein
MEFLHVGIYRQRYRELLAEVPVFGNQPPDPFVIQCPRCGDTYLADLGPYDEPFDLEEQEWAATVRLARECPDHSHRFTVGLDADAG